MVKKKLLLPLIGDEQILTAFWPFSAQISHQLFSYQDWSPKVNCFGPQRYLWAFIIALCWSDNFNSGEFCVFSKSRTISVSFSNGFLKLLLCSNLDIGWDSSNVEKSYLWKEYCSSNNTGAKILIMKSNSFYNHGSK